MHFQEQIITRPIFFISGTLIILKQEYTVQDGNELTGLYEVNQSLPESASNLIIPDNISVRCDECTYTCTSRRQLGQHIRLEHPYNPSSSKETVHLCPRCKHQYKNRHHMRAHYLHECGKPPRFKCPFCDHTAKQKTNLTTHMIRMHPQEPLVSMAGSRRSRKY